MIRDDTAEQDYPNNQNFSIFPLGNDNQPIQSVSPKVNLIQGRSFQFGSKLEKQTNDAYESYNDLGFKRPLQNSSDIDASKTRNDT